MQIQRNRDLLLGDFQKILGGEKVEIDIESIDYIQRSFGFLQEFSNHKTIYGINTGLGPMAQYKVDEDKQVELQYNLIRSHCAGSGRRIDDIYVKAAMICRLRSIIQGISGIHPSSAQLLQELINRDIFPVIPEHGGVGASGDLVQLSHIALILIGEGTVMYEGKLCPTAEVFRKNNLQPIRVVLREGLSLINGTSVMTGIGLVNILRAKTLLSWSVIAGALLSEIVESFGDYFSEELNRVKGHPGQQFIAGELRNILADSQLISSREAQFYNHINDRVFKRKVQEFYSLRCIPQILGPVYDTIAFAEKVLLSELNSVNDNPIVCLECENVFHGGNFHGDYVSLEMDKLKLVITRLSMIADRQINFLFNSNLNEKLPPFVNLGVLGLNLGMQGMQFTATSTTAENQTLSSSVYIHSIPTNNDNQDIVSMGTNSALMAARVVDNAFQVIAIELIGLLQAVDYLKIEDKLSSKTKNIYRKLRTLVPVFVVDTPKFEEIERVYQYIIENQAY
ncbi:MAG: aromatic amino acid ammonia-lyase [Bacteroidota bacterium]